MGIGNTVSTQRNKRNKPMENQLEKVKTITDTTASSDTVHRSYFDYEAEALLAQSDKKQN
jgi:hypothetical protein